MIGRTISHYRILEKLGEGGMGVVYKGEDTKLKRIVALKFLAPQVVGSEDEKTRFVHEAQTAAALDHPNICTAYEIDEADGQPFIAMGYVEGQSLKQKIEAGPLKLGEALDIVIQAAEGLQAAHEKEIVHRDIKSANIMVTTKGQVKIMDFGLAKLTGRTKLSKANGLMGTVAYMSPEQARGEHVDHRTDIWSLGIVIYELVTRRLPFYSDYEQAMVYSILNEDPKPITRLCPGLPVELELVVNNALAKRVNERYQHIDEMLVDLRTIRKKIEFGTTTKTLTKGRRLAAIMFTDIVGYTTIMEEDESRARALRRRLQNNHLLLVSEYGGQILQFYGDGVLCCFRSAIEATRCAVSIQQRLREDPEIPVRIGIHLGDVVFEGEGIVGDGVNVASRIQQSAAPGGICISEKVYDELRNHPDIEARSLGRVELKNVRWPIEIFALTGEGLAVPEEIKVKEDRRMPEHTEVESVKRKEGLFLPKPPIPRLLRQIAGSLAVVLATFLLLWFVPPTQQLLKEWMGIGQIPTEKGLAVLPFTNVGGNTANQAFCDGLVETLNSKLTQLEQFHGSLWVIPTSDVRKQNVTSAIEAREAFGINLAVTGSVQLIDGSFRLTLNLVDAINLRQLSSSVIDDHLANVSVLQDETVFKVANMLNVELQPQARRILTEGGTTVPGAYEFYLQGRGYLQRYEKEENINTAIDLFTRAIKLDSSYALAYAGLGEAYWRRYETSKDAQWVEHAVRNCKRAVELNDLLTPVNVTLGLILTGTGRYAEAIEELHRALNIDPASADAYRGLAKAYEAEGLLKEAETTYKKAIELKPDYWAGYNDLGVFYSCHGRYEDAAAQFRHVTKLIPLNARGYRNLGGVYFYLNRRRDAIQVLKRSLEIEPTSEAYANVATFYFYEQEYTNAARMYEKALDFQSSDYRIWGFLASAYYWTPDERERAREVYQRAIIMAEEKLEINPRDAESLSYLPSYYAMIGEDAKARRLLHRLVDFEHEDVEILFQIGHTYELLQDRELALDWIGKALEKGLSPVEIEHQPSLEDLRADTRFVTLLEGIGSKSRQEMD